MEQGFYNVLVELAKIGAAGVGIAIFLMVFFMIVRGKPVDPDTASLRKSFLMWGFAFAVVVGLFTIVPPLLQPKGGPVAMRLSFSPDMADEGLTVPRTELPDGDVIQAGQQFSLSPSPVPQVLTVRVDKTLKEVANLREATAKLAASVSDVQQQRDTLAQQVAASTPPSSAPAALETQSQKTDALQSQVVESLKAGDYAKANALSSQLHTTVVLSRPAVAAIAGHSLASPH